MFKSSLYKIIPTIFLVFVLAISLYVPLIIAATTPNLGISGTFAILSSTYSNVAGGTTINGDLGYTTPPAVAPTVNGNTHIADSTYNQAGIDQGSALSALNSQPCTFTFAPGAIDLASDTTHGLIGMYTPGVYCITGAASIGGGGTITFTGSGTYIFRMTGALNTSDNSVIAILNGASTCDIFWTPGAATTLGANSNFIGTDIDASGITIGSNVTWIGRALAFGGTVSTDSDTLSVPTCNANVSTSNASSSGTNSNSNGASAPCIPTEIRGTPRIIETRRISSSSIFLSWGPYEGMNTFLIEYGFENGQWLYNTTVTGFSTTINSLPDNQNIWVRIAPTDNCAVGNYSEAQLIGNPGLPNAGFVPKEKGFLHINSLKSFIIDNKRFITFFNK